MSIEYLIEKHHGERTFFDHELVGVYFTIQNLEAAIKQAVEDYKASLDPVGYYVGVENEYGYDLVNLDKAIPVGTELYALGETKLLSKELRLSSM